MTWVCLLFTVLNFEKQKHQFQCYPNGDFSWLEEIQGQILTNFLPTPYMIFVDYCFMSWRMVAVMMCINYHFRGKSYSPFCLGERFMQIIILKCVCLRLVSSPFWKETKVLKISYSKPMYFLWLVVHKACLQTKKTRETFRG